MPKKFIPENTKVTAAKERKAAQQLEKDQKAAEERERKEKTEWSKGARDISRKEAEEAKKAEKLARKAEAKLLLEKEEKILVKAQSVRVKHDPAIVARSPSATFGASVAKSTATKSASSAVAGPKASTKTAVSDSASNKDATKSPSPSKKAAVCILAGADCDASDDEAGVLTAEKRNELIHTLTLAALDRHPEKRARAAWLLFCDRETPRMQEEYPNTRRSTIQKILRKEWSKSPENPMNKSMLSYNSTLDEEAEVLAKLKISESVTTRVNYERESKNIK